MSLLEKHNPNQSHADYRVVYDGLRYFLGLALYDADSRVIGVRPVTGETFYDIGSDSNFTKERISLSKMAEAFDLPILFRHVIYEDAGTIVPNGVADPQPEAEPEVTAKAAIG